MERDVMTVKEVSARLDQSEEWVHNACKRGDIPHIRVGNKRLIPKLAFESWLIAETQMCQVCRWIDFHQPHCPNYEPSYGVYCRECDCLDYHHPNCSSYEPQQDVSLLEDRERLIESLVWIEKRLQNNDIAVALDIVNNTIRRFMDKKLEELAS